MDNFKDKLLNMEKKFYLYTQFHKYEEGKNSKADELVEYLEGLTDQPEAYKIFDNLYKLFLNCGEQAWSPFYDSLHKLTDICNINPVRIAMYLQANHTILLYAHHVAQLLEGFSEDCIKDADDKKTVMKSLRFHHLKYVLVACQKFCVSQESLVTGPSVLEPLIKVWLKGDKSGYPVELEMFLREDIMAYPHVDVLLRRKLISWFAPDIGEEPSAMRFMSVAVRGHLKLDMDDTSACETCGDPVARSRCSSCKSVKYCDRKCQELHWFTHKTLCKKLKVFSHLREFSEVFSDVL